MYWRKKPLRFFITFLFGVLSGVMACSDTPKTSRGSRQITIPPFRSDASLQNIDASAETVDATLVQDASSSEDAGSATDSGQTTEADAGQGMSDAGEDEPTPAIPICMQSCSDVRDCVLAPGGLYDVDNYQCTSNGVCEWTGCNSDAECITALSNTSYVCDLTAALPFCVLSCTTASDCVANPAATGAYDADNYTCSQQRCSYSGCNTDAECQTSLGMGYRCVPGPQNQASYCTKGCQSVRDCVSPSPLYDEDNYECRDSICAYTGCNTNLECATGFNNQDYICVTP